MTAHANVQRRPVSWLRLMPAIGALTLLPAAVHTCIVAVGVGSNGFLMAAVGLLVAAGVLGVLAYKTDRPVQIPSQATQ